MQCVLTPPSSGHRVASWCCRPRPRWTKGMGRHLVLAAKTSRTRHATEAGHKSEQALCKVSPPCDAHRGEMPKYLAISRHSSGVGGLCSAFSSSSCKRRTLTPRASRARTQPTRNVCMNEISPPNQDPLAQEKQHTALCRAERFTLCIRDISRSIAARV